MATLLKPPAETGPSSLKKTETAVPNEPAVFMLDTNGVIRTCNKAAGQWLGCSSTKLVWQHVSNILPQLTETKLMQDGHINPRLRYLSRIGHRFQLAIPGGERESGRIFINDLENAGRHIVRLIVYPDRQAALAENTQHH